MTWSSAKESVKRTWSRRWVRRITYTLVGGTAVVATGTWVLDRPFVYQWLVGQADVALRKETGLSLSVGQVEFHPLLGTLTLRDIAVGGDLLHVSRLDLQADPGSLFGSRPRIFSLRLDHPHLRLTEANLAQIHLRERPPRKGPLPQVTLDLLALTGGEVEIPEPVRGLPATRFRFEVKGTGVGPNRLQVAFTAPQLIVKGPDGWEKGRIDFKGEVSEPVLLLHEGYARLGDSQLRLTGRFDPRSLQKPERVEARISGVVGLVQALRWAGIGPHPPLEGSLDLTATVRGTLAHPRWTFSADGLDLRPASTSLEPGNLEVRAQGGLDQARLERLRWSSPQGSVEAEGAWTAHHQTRLRVQGGSISLDALSRMVRVPELQGVRTTLEAQIQGPGDPAEFRQLDRWEGTARLALDQNGRDAGGLSVSLGQGLAQVQDLNLDLENLKVQGSARTQLGPRSLVDLQAQGAVQVDAAQVAHALAAWKVVDLDMGGRTQAQAQVRWSAAKGLELDGDVEVGSPRWHGATVDQLKAQVEIRRSDLSVRDIQIEKGGGRGGGDLWLTWGRVPKGQPQMDMCYTAFRLPVAEGLRAADVKDDEGRDLPLTGTGSGWVRLHGPFDHLLMEGQAQVESGEAYGIRIPAASSDFDMDLDTLRLRLGDVRVAERPDLLGAPGTAPEGALALTGKADMDIPGWTWRVDLAGRMDSQLLGLPGPHLQSQVKARLLGPVTSPFGPVDLPEGDLAFTRGRIFLFGRSVEGLEGNLRLERGRFQSRLGTEGMTRPLLTLQARTRGTGLSGALNLRVAPDTARTASIAGSLTEDLLEDLQAELDATGTWTPQLGLRWSGHVTRLEGLFSAFELHQSGPSDLRGDAAAADLDLTLQGGERGAAGPRGPAAAIHLSGRAPFTATGPLALQAKGSADLAHLKAILDRVMEVDEYSLLSDLRVNGGSRFDLLLHGTYEDPLLDGDLRLERGQMRLQGYQGMEDLNAEFLLKDRTLSISEAHPLTGTLAHGQLLATGGLSWKPGGVDRYGFQASLGNFQLRDVPDGLDLQGTLNATLDGNEDGGMLRGRLRADHLSYQTEVKLSDLILRSALSDSGGLTGLDPDDPLDRIGLDLDLDLRNPWSFDTNLLKLEGKTDGRFRVQGTLAHPIPNGTLEFTPGGRVTNIFPAGDMVVDRGSLVFKGESDRIDPIINLRGSVTSIPGYTVNLDVHGTLSNLNIVPSSTPTLRQDEIVAILINPGNVANVGTGATTSAQGALTSGLASASAGLLSTLAFAPFQDQLRRTLGLDRVNVAVRSSSLGTTETDVTLGKSINLFGQRSAFVVSHQKSAEQTQTSGQIEWRFGGVILQLGVSQSGQSGLNPSGEIRHTWSPR
ncbi:MAG TPA: translocation/assembly module TamB domain-containing protein [Holophagaceae bacterium]